MKKLMIFVDWFAPGFKAGGQIQSCVNLASALQQELQVMVVTTDRDLGNDQPYDEIIPDQWNRFEDKIQVMYLSPENRGYKSIRSLIRSQKPDIIYLNSMFSFNLSLLPLEVCRFDNWIVHVVLAPRGMLHSGALQFKRMKKKLFFHAFKVRGFHKRILFHATDKTELEDIKQMFGKNAQISFVDDFPASKQDPVFFLPKETGFLKCLFIARVCKTKNLLYLLNLLQRVKVNIELTIAGPVEDPDYWEECKEVIAVLPSNIKVNFLGPVPNNLLHEIYRSHHLFILPTVGENFGHVIFESLLNGRPVLISDLTPWKQLESKHAGWDIPLAEEERFMKAILTAVNWNQEVFDSYCKSCWTFASTYTDIAPLKKQYLQLFQ
ncbi:MAG: glycosyltransferase [Chitinophagaceae bacterium]